MSVSYSGDELIKISGQGDKTPFISGNGSGLVKLGELLIHIGLSEDGDGYHLHVYEDLNGDKPEIA